MYVDEKRAGEAEVDTRSDLERFIAWAKTRDPSESYLFTDAHYCLIARWEKSEQTFTHLRSGREVFSLFGGRGKDIVLYKSSTDHRTVGGALAAALKVQKEQCKTLVS